MRNGFSSAFTHDLELGSVVEQGFKLPPDSRTVARSFRVSEKALHALEEEAARQNTSINTLENQILIQYYEFGRFAQRISAMAIARTTFAAILGLGADEDLVKVARRMAKSVPQGYMNAKWGALTPAAALGLVHDVSSYGNWFEYFQSGGEGGKTLTLMHELGHKWTVFVAAYFAEVFMMVGLKPDVSSTDRSVTFYF